MRKAIVFGCIVAVAALGLLLLRAPSEPGGSGDSPAFQALLDDAIIRLDGVAQQVTAVSAPEALADPQQPTVDEYTCVGFRTCDAIATCDGNPTCDGEITCWASTCAQAPTCEATCGQYTTEPGVPTCEGEATCEEGCAGWPTYHGMTETCQGGPTCEYTCSGYVTCSGCVSTDRTTWGSIKAEFSK
jgi:hypothetical protein